MTESSILSATAVSKSYFGSEVLKSVSLDLAPRQITALIGPNGAGKTTLFDIVTGFVRADKGRVAYGGRDITRMSAYQRARQGIVKTFQIPHPFDDLTVEENMLVAAPDQTGERFPAGLFARRLVRTERQMHLRQAERIMEFLGLRANRHATPAVLSAGDKKLLELARALMMKPVVLMLDEPLAGVPFDVGEKIVEHLVSLRNEGITLLVVEHNLDAIMRIADVVYVLVDGELLSRGSPEAVQQDDRVLHAYLTGTGSV